MTNAIDRYLNAAVWAQQFGKNALFVDVQIGEEFKFGKDGRVYRKTSSRSYRGADGRKYLAGKYAGVIRGEATETETTDAL